MKSITKQIIITSIFLILVVSCILVIELFFRTNVQPQTIAFQKEQIWDAYKTTLPNNTLQYAFFGDSVTAHAVYTPLLSSSFNFALGGEDYVETYYRYKQLSSEVNITHVVFQLNIHSFSSGYRKPEYRFRRLDFFSQNIPSSIIQQHSTHSLVKIKIHQYWQGINKGREMMKSLLHYSITTSLGWENYTTNYTAQTDKEFILQDVMRVYFPYETYIADTTSEDYFFTLIDEVHKQNKTIIFFIPPVEKEYFARLQTKNISTATIVYPLLDELSRKNISFQVLNYEELFFEYEDYFADPSHLNYHGALALTLQLKEDLAHNEIIS